MEENNVPPQPIAGKNGFNPLYLVGGLAFLGLIAYFVVSGGKKTAPVTEVESVGTEVTPLTSEATLSGSVKEFTVDGSSFEFDPKTITVSKGDTVKITFKDNDGRHDLVVDGYNVRTNVIGPGATDTVEFVADKSGSFEYFCSVSNHKELGMTGKLVVQ
jgi:nitrite reductase (NO-forming)